ncbi:MAG: hypothetical protein ACKVS6_12825 [Planctomycetota bacterium]
MEPGEPIEQFLSKELETDVSVIFTNNSWTVMRYTAYDHGKKVKIRLHRIFKDAPPEVRDAVLTWAKRPTRKVGTVIDRFIHANHATIGESAAEKHLDPKGQFYNLSEIFVKLNSEYFEGSLNCKIGYGTAGGSSRRRVRRALQFGAFDSVHRAIRIHPVLDAAWIPVFFIEYIIYHEMLHAAIPIRIDAAGRRIHHSAEFRNREKLFLLYQEARAWEKANIRKVLREAGKLVVDGKSAT